MGRVIPFHCQVSGLLSFRPSQWVQTIQKKKEKAGGGGGCDLSVCLLKPLPHFQFPFNGVLLLLHVLLHTNILYLAYMGNVSVICGSKAGNVRHLHLPFCYDVCWWVLNCRTTRFWFWSVLLCDCLPCTVHRLLCLVSDVSFKKIKDPL